MAEANVINISSDISDISVRSLSLCSTDSDVMEVEREYLTGKWPAPTKIVHSDEAWKEPPINQPEKVKRRSIIMGHPDVSPLAARHVKVLDLIQGIQCKVLNRLIQGKDLTRFHTGEVQEKLQNFLNFTNARILELRCYIGTFAEYDQLTGRRIDHVERLVEQLQGVVNNIQQYVLEQVKSYKGSISFKRMAKCPENWHQQLVLSSLENHLKRERRVLEHLQDSYHAVARASNRALVFSKVSDASLQ